MERLEPLDQKPRGGRNDGHWSGGNTLLRSMKWLSHAKSNSPGWSAWKSKIFFSGLIMFSAALCGQYLGNSAIRPGFDMSYSFWYGWTKLDMSLSFYWKTQLLTGGFRFVCVFFFLNLNVKLPFGNQTWQWNTIEHTSFMDDLRMQTSVAREFPIDNWYIWCPEATSAGY